MSRICKECGKELNGHWFYLKSRYGTCINCGNDIAKKSYKEGKNK